MYLIDEENGARGFKFVDHPLKALLELTAIHRPGDQRAHIQLQDAFAQQQSGYVALDDALGKPLHNGGFADAGFPDQGRVVLVAPRQNLNDALDLHLSADHRVELVFFGARSQVDRKLVDQRGFGAVLLFFGARLSRSIRAAGCSAAFLQYPPCLATDLFGGNAQLAQYLHRAAVGGTDQPQQEVFCSNVMMPHSTGFFDSQFEYLLHAGREIDFSTARLTVTAQAFNHLLHAVRLKS